jgi:hypothetical protein
MKLFHYKIIQKCGKTKENILYYELGKIFNENRIIAPGFNIFSQKSFIYKLHNLKILYVKQGHIRRLIHF